VTAPLTLARPPSRLASERAAAAPARRRSGRLGVRPLGKVHDLGAGLTSGARLTGLLGAHLALVQLVLLAPGCPGSSASSASTGSASGTAGTAMRASTS